MASYAYGLDKMQYSTNLITYHDSERNTILDYSIEIVPLNEEDTIFYWLDIANYSVTGFQINLQRNSLKYLVNYYLPSGLFVIVSWASIIFNNFYENLLKPLQPALVNLNLILCANIRQIVT
jgi:hypothetical protein